MSFIKSEAIILKNIKFGESSKIISMLSDTSGKFSAMVKGARASNSRFTGIFENMNLVSIYFNKRENKDLQYISKADCICNFASIKSDLQKITSAYKLLELTNKTIYEYDNNKDIFTLLKDALYFLNDSDINPDLLYLYFQLQLAIVLGINPIDYERNFDEVYFVSDREQLKKLYFNNLQLNFLKKLTYKVFKDLVNIEYDKELVTEAMNLYDKYFMESSGHISMMKSSVLNEKLNRKII